MAHEKVFGLFGWKPSVSFPEGLPKTISWYLENRAWWQDTLRRGYEPVRIGLKA
jgi:dTDP-glucose 4,6-dehydratase